MPDRWDDRERDEQDRGARRHERGPDYVGDRYGAAEYGSNRGRYGYGDSRFDPVRDAPGRPPGRYRDDRDDHHTPNVREGRGEEARSWWDRASDTVASMLGDDDARRRHNWDELRAGHRGRGPKGYRRSDDRIREDVNDRLTEDPYLDASEIEVTVADSEVTLAGIVYRREDKRRAENLAESVTGVTHVQNNLRPRQLDPAARNGEVL